MVEQEQPTGVAYAVIMAGGSGERFWPLSRIAQPKQLLCLGPSGRTMLEDAIRRVEGLIPLSRILIVTSAVLKPSIEQRLPWFPAANVIAEPSKRNTAPCLALAAAEILHREGSSAQLSLMAVLTADHYISNEVYFRQNVQQALEYAGREGALVTIGVQPSRPETGYGYIEVDPLAVTENDAVMKVKAFREKPDRDTAMKYVLGGKHLWNSGMFFWRTSVFLEQLKKHLPVVGNAVSEMLHARNEGEAMDSATIAEIFNTLPDISVDFGVMERADNVAVVPAGFIWDDVGSWDALFRLQEQTQTGSVHDGEVIDLGSSHSVVVNASRDHVVAVIDVHDIVVVATPDATLVCGKDSVQRVKEVVGKLRETGKMNFL